MMTRYLNLGGNSNVKEFFIGEDYIDVVFKDRSIYRYSYASAGREHVDHMKILAHVGSDLNSYIKENVLEKYEKKGWI